MYTCRMRSSHNLETTNKQNFIFHNTRTCLGFFLFISEYARPKHPEKKSFSLLIAATRKQESKVFQYYVSHSLFMQVLRSLARVCVNSLVTKI